MATSTYPAGDQQAVSQLYAAFFGRAADGAGFNYWLGQIASGIPIKTIAQSFYNSLEAQSVYGVAPTSQQFISQFYSSVLGRTADAGGAAYWNAQLNTAGATQGSVAVDIIYALLHDTSTDPVVVTSQNLMNARTAVSSAYANANGSVAGANAILFGVVDTASANTAIASFGNGVTGVTTPLTAGADHFTGTNDNDTFIADNTGASPNLGVGDTIDGGNNVDTLKIYLAAGGTANPILSGISNIENVYIYSGALTALDVSAVAGVTNLQIDSSNAAAIYTVGAGQAVTLTKAGGLNLTTIATTAANSAINVTVNGQAAGSGLALTGAALTTANLIATGAASSFTLSNPSGTLTTLNVFGDKAVSIVENLGTLKTVNAATDTGSVLLDTRAGALNAAFTFGGGTGADTLTISAAGLTALTAGSQLDGGAGIDTLAVTNTSFSAADYAKLSGIKNFEILAVNGATNVDAAQITSLKEFSVAGNSTFVNAGAGNIFDITAGSTLTIGTALGNTATTVNLGNAATTGFTIGALTTTGITSIALNSNGSGTNILTALHNNDNSTITIAGTAALTIGAIDGATTGSIVNGAALTGALTVTGSNRGDTLIGGSAADTLIAGSASSTLTGNGGADKFVVANTVYGAAGQMDTITDFTKGTDLLGLAVQGSAAFTAAAINVSAAANFTAALNTAVAALASGNINAQVDWFQFGGNTYVVESVSAAHTVVANSDLVVKLTGAIDLSTAAINANTSVLA